jgi:hypothetical protein
MATMTVRAKQIIDSIADGDVGSPLALRIAAAFALKAGHPDPGALTNGEKATIFVRDLRHYIKNNLAQHELRKVELDARNAAEPGTNINIGVD